MNPSFVKAENCPTKLQEIAKAYVESNQPFWQNTRPNHSVQSLQADVVQTDLANSRAIVRFNARQTMAFFSYGIGSIIQLSGNPQHRVTEAETNITEAAKTNNDDFAIDWVGVSHRGNKVSYANNPFTDTDADFILAMQGQRSIYDPFSYRVPPEFGSPALLENGVFQKLLELLSLRFEWDNGTRTEKVGIMDQFTQGGGASYLSSNGEPSAEARIMVPEGYSWTRSGQPGSQLQAFATLQQDLFVPISLVNPSGAQAIAPDHLYVEFMLRLGGVHFLTPSTN